MSCDTAFVRIKRPAEEVFAFMAEPAQLTLWSFGTWRVEVDRTGLIRGTSLKDGTPIYLRIEAHPAQSLIDYHLGTTPDGLTPRIFVRVTPEAVFGDREGAGLSMTAMRAQGIDDARWANLIAAHRVELDIIKSALEIGYDHRTA